jgi:uncharacterized lipoprotein YddW (UPF0748 family)
MSRVVLRSAVAALAATLTLLCWRSSVLPVHAQDEVRALWVVRTTLTSPAAIATMVASAKKGGFNTLLIQIRGRGDAFYQGSIEPRPASLAAQPAFDPLAVAIARAHEAGLQVHAWINVNLISGAGELPVAREHVMYRHPEWLMVPKSLADVLAGVDPHSPEYIGRLTRDVRSQPAELEGLYLSPVSAASVDYTAGIVHDVATRYAIDGVHFDYLRYPNDDFDYSRDTLAAFRQALGGDLPAADARRYDARLAAGEPLIYTQAYPERWRAFRADRLTALLTTLRQAVRTAKPAAVVSVAVTPDPREAATRRLQDWRGWLDANLVDVVCPMAYTADATLFASQVAAARQFAGMHALWAGIGAYRLSSEQIVENVKVARRLGAGGIILFSYDSLTDPARGRDYLTEVGRSLGLLPSSF